MSHSPAPSNRTQNLLHSQKTEEHDVLQGSLHCTGGGRAFCIVTQFEIEILSNAKWSPADIFNSRLSDIVTQNVFAHVPEGQRKLLSVSDVKASTTFPPSSEADSSCRREAVENRLSKVIFSFSFISNSLFKAPPFVTDTGRQAEQWRNSASTPPGRSRRMDRECHPPSTKKTFCLQSLTRLFGDGFQLLRLPPVPPLAASTHQRGGGIASTSARPIAAMHCRRKESLPLLFVF